MGRENKVLGRSGEEIAAEFLRSRGYLILEMNYRTPLGELDIIARHGDSTVFVEVKTRATSSLGPPYLSITRQKKRHIVHSALVYLKRYNLVGSFWRVDAVSVKLGLEGEVEEIELFENIIEEGDY